MPANPLQQILLDQQKQSQPEPPDVTGQINALPNADKLTPIERWTYEKLPGFAESSTGQALAKFGESPFGKILSKLDVPAEGLERGLGFLTQYADRDPNEDFDFKSAWYASSMTYDVANLPTFKRNAAGGITGLEITEDLPGLSSLVHARKRISGLTRGGMSYSEALTTTRDDYYNNLGALQLRAQINDVWGHVALDPLNYLLPALKPVERLTAIRHLALAGKIPLDEVQDALRIAEKAGNLDEVGRLAGIIADVEKGTVKQINSWDKFAIMATGGNPLDWTPPTTKLGKLAEKINPLTLRRESRAQEMVAMVSDHIGAQVISRHMDDPKAIAEALERASRGALGPEYGTAFLSLEGRLAQGQLGAISAHTSDLYRAYELTRDERALLNILSDTLGDNSTRLLKEISQNPEVVLKRLANAEDATIQALLQRGELTAGTLGEMAKVMENVPHTPELFALEVMAKVEDITMQQSLIRFGVEARGLTTRWAGALKAAESFAFLRLNPGYAVRNIINNDMTMLARGLFGTMLPGQIDDFWKLEGWTPQRLGQGFGLGGPEVKITSKSGQMVDDALRGGNYGAPEKIKDFFTNINIGQLDATYWGAKMEQSASKRAFTSGYVQGMREYFWKPGKGFDRITSALTPAQVDELRRIDPGLPELIEDAIAASAGRDSAIDAALKTNINLNYATAERQVSENLGYQVGDVFGPELTDQLAKGLPQAASAGKLDEFAFGMRTALQAHLDDLHQKELAELPGLTAEMVKAGGPGMYYKTLGDMTDNFWSAHSEHAIRMSQVTDSARAAARSGDFERAGVIWDKILGDEDKFFGRMWKRFDATLEGLEKGAKEAGIPLSPKVRAGYADVRKTWNDFFKFRQQEYKKLRKSDNFLADYDALKIELDSRYAKAIGIEGKSIQTVDDAVAAGIENPELREAFSQWRGQVAKLRLKDKTDSADFMKAVRDLPADERPAAFKEYWKKRNENYTELWGADKIGNQMMAGDPQAAAFVDSLPAEAGEASEGAAALRKIAGELGLGEQQTAAHDRYLISTVNKYFDMDEPHFILAKAKSLPRNKLPKRTRERMEQEARRLIDELYGGEGPGVAVSRQVDDFETTRFGTTNISWYRDLPENMQNKDVIDKALNKIIEDAGKDKGVNVERMKDLILDRFTYGDKATGTPPDLAVLMELGAPDATIERALDNLFEITGQRMTLEEALNMSGWTQGFGSLDEIPPALAQLAFESIAREPGSPAVFLGDMSKIFPDQLPLAPATDELMFGRGFAALDALTDAYKDAGARSPAILENLPAGAKQAVMGYVNRAKGQAGDARYAATRFAEFRRDSALLNYNRRNNFDAWAGNYFPFLFWTTGSLHKWAIHSIDRPAMLTTTLRMKKFIETSGLQNEGMASRLKGKIRIKMPFTPEWAGDAFIDPIGLALPFDSFMQPLEQHQKNQYTVDGRADRLLDDLLQDGEITEKEYNEAKTHEGPVWDQARALAIQNDDNLKFDAFNFASLMSSPHAPVLWAYNAARGHPEDTGPFMPLSRTSRNVATMLGIEDWNNSPLNMEAKIRKSMGLPSYDRWDDYRNDRMLSNMLATGEYTQAEINDAMFLSSQVQNGEITSEEAKAQSAVYAEAIKKANIEFAGGGPAATILKTLGINVVVYPTGEKAQRALQDDFSRAYEAHNNGSPTALNNFFEKHPEYESRLALYDEPEERMRKFMVDDLWAKYNDLPKITRDELADQLGRDFREKFRNSETRAYDSLTVDEMQVWLKLMNGENPGVLSANARLVYQLFGDLELTDPETAQRGQVFYDMRETYFPDWYEEQQGYYALPEGKQRKEYKRAHQEFRDYSSWRVTWMRSNPDLVPYLTDSQWLIDEAKDRKRQPQATYTVPTSQELLGAMPQPLQELMLDYSDDLPDVAWKELDYFGQQYGLSGEQVYSIVLGE